MSMLKPHDRVFVLTGAGISAESGLKTFRDAGGLWEGHRVEAVATPEAFRAHPERVWRFYAQRRQQHAAVAPNAAHRALAALETVLGDRFFLCTQNVDTLHEQAGSQRLVHMHGQLLKTRCSNEACASAPFDDEQPHMLHDGRPLPRCPHCQSLLRPHICWFGEMPFEMERVMAELDACTWFLSIGTSGQVEPAASFVRMARTNSTRYGAHTVYIGPEAPGNADAFTDILLGKAGERLPPWVAQQVT